MTGWVASNDSNQIPSMPAYAYMVGEGEAATAANAANKPLTRDELQALQLERLNQTLEWARQQSRYYRQKLPARRLSGLDELQELPLTSASDLAASTNSLAASAGDLAAVADGPNVGAGNPTTGASAPTASAGNLTPTPNDPQPGYQKLLCVQASAVSRMVTIPTSGTTGQPKRVAFTAADHAATVNYFAAGMRMLAGAGESIAVLFPCDRPAGLGRLLCESVQLAGGRAIPYGIPQNFKHIWECFNVEGVRGAVGFPQQLLAFSRLCEHNSIDPALILDSNQDQALAQNRDQGLTRGLSQNQNQPHPQALNLRNLILTADNVAPSLRKEIERIWGGTAFAHFGMTETGYGGAVECPAHNGLHVRESDLIFEVIDPLSLKPLPNGQWGELVFTTLNQQAMPFIRYRSGDYSRILPGQCSCGSILKRIDNVKGRRDEYAQVLGHSFGMPELEEPLFALPGLLDFKAGFDSKTAKLQLEAQLLPNSLSAQAEIVNHLRQSQPFDELLGNGLISIKIKVTEQSDFAPYYPGKRRLLNC